MPARRVLPLLCALAATLTASLLASLTACGRAGTAGRSPAGEFLVSTPDSTFWIATGGSRTRVRGAPIVLARYDGRFYEVYSVDDDFSFEDAQLVGERVYRRDLLSGDSALVFADTVVRQIAEAYARSHPDERPLAPGDEGEAQPSTMASAEVDILDVAGPYLSYEYHVDVTLPHRRLWHSTRRGVIDLRAGHDVALSALLGEARAGRVAAEGQHAFERSRDSIAQSGGVLSADDRRAADALRGLAFDARSFSLDHDDGTLQVVFGVPGRGEGAAGNLVELDPIDVDSVSWWGSAVDGTPRQDDAGDDRWRRAGYQVIARYDSSGTLVRLSIADSARREWPLADILGPIHRIEWLDRPAVDAATRTALSHAFDQAATYDENARVALRRPRSSLFLPARYRHPRR